MQLLAVTAEQIGYWADKLITVAVVALGFTWWRLVARKRRQVAAEWLDDLDAERKAEAHKADGPPRFNG